MIKKVLFAVLFGSVFAVPVFSSPVEIMHRITFLPRLNLNRTLPNRFSLPLQYTFEMKNGFFADTGISFETTTGYIRGYYFRAGWNNIVSTPFGGSLQFAGTQYAEYERSVNSIIIAGNGNFEWNRYFAGFEIGVNFRFLNIDSDRLWNIFYYPDISREAILCYYGVFGMKFFDERYRVFIRFDNRDDFLAGNLGHYGFFFGQEFDINSRFTVKLIPGFRQSGSVALAATYYQAIIYFGGEIRL